MVRGTSGIPDMAQAKTLAASAVGGTTFVHFRADRLYARAMQHFMHGDVEIAFLDEGAGEPIVLVHGFASNKE